MVLYRCLTGQPVFLLFVVIFYGTSYAHDERQLIRTNFVNSMRGMSKTSMANNPLALLLRSLYNKYVLQDLVWSNQVRIPKIIHQIWLGSPLPERYSKWQRTWVDNHPDWLYILWDDQKLEDFPMVNKKAFQEARSYGVKSDIARYEILFQMGGLYVDTDMECLRPMDAFHYCCNFYAGFEPSAWCILNSIIGCSPGHPIMKECIIRMRNSDTMSSDFHSVVNNTGPEYLTRCFLNVIRMHEERCIIFPSGYFFPFSANERYLEATCVKNCYVLKHMRYTIGMDPG